MNRAPLKTHSTNLVCPEFSKVPDKKPPFTLKQFHGGIIIMFFILQNQIAAKIALKNLIIAEKKDTI